MNNFDKMINAINHRQNFQCQIEGYNVIIQQNWFSDRGLSSLYINDRESNSCLPYAMKKLIREWKDGKRYICDFENGGLLVKKY